MVELGSKIGHTSVSNEIVALNAELVKAQPKAKLWAARCVTALGYVKTISQFTNAISPSVLADAEAAAATCAALTADPTVTAASVATGIAQSIVTLQNAAQVPK